jgi:hypothetical protein
MTNTTAEHALLRSIVELMVTGFDGDELGGDELPQEQREEFRHTIETLTENSPRQRELVECALGIFDELFPPDDSGLVQSMYHAPESYRTS